VAATTPRCPRRRSCRGPRLRRRGETTPLPVETRPKKAESAEAVDLEPTQEDVIEAPTKDEAPSKDAPSNDEGDDDAPNCSISIQCLDGA